MSSDLPKVIITDFINDSLSIEKKFWRASRMRAFDAYDELELHGKIESAKAVMLYHNLSLSATTIERLTRCELIVRCGVGFDNVDHAFARQGIAVANVPDYGTEEVADSAIGMALTLSRGVTSSINACEVILTLGCITCLNPFTDTAVAYSESLEWAGLVQQLPDARNGNGRPIL